jgi:peptidylprolyl isomerase
VAQIKALTKRGFYDGIVFHRVIPGFMAQTGDPTGTGTGKSDLPNIPAEFTREPYKAGTVGMARSQSPAFGEFAVLHLLRGLRLADGQYTVVGEVTSGMDAVRKIKAGTAANNGAVSSPDKIVKMQLAADAR